jgi:hypothetical protein
MKLDTIGGKIDYSQIFKSESCSIEDWNLSVHGRQSFVDSGLQSNSSKAFLHHHHLLPNGHAPEEEKAASRVAESLCSV